MMWLAEARRGIFSSDRYPHARIKRIDTSRAVLSVSVVLFLFAWRMDLLTRPYLAGACVL